MIELKEVTKLTETYAELSDTTRSMFYLCHHGVPKGPLKDQIRIVFDAGCKNTQGISLNNILLPGPKGQLDLVELLIGFRRHPIVILADVKRMFHQILIKNTHDLFRFLWKEKVGRFLPMN